MQQRWSLWTTSAVCALFLLVAAPAPAARQIATSTAITAQAASSVPQVTFSKRFEGSVPLFYRVVLRENGQAEYSAQETANEPMQTIRFNASPQITERVFALARKLNYFSRKLEAKNKVSRMGIKTVAYDDATHHQTQTYNFTTNPDASALTDIFEKISETGEHASRLRQLLRYDHLGLVKELNGITRDWDQHELLEPQMLQPTLESIAANEALLDIARKRADSLLVAMRTPPTR